MQKKTWFITGASRGFGRIWAEAALKRGDNVVATARNLESISDLKTTYGVQVLPLALDVRNLDQVKSVVDTAFAHFGTIDILLNNAGYALVGAIEEPDEASIRDEFETNFFGTLRVIRQALPYLRKQGNGHIVGVSSVAGLLAHAITGYYSASKWAFEAVHESLSQEVAGLGLKVTIIEPGAYATTFASQTSLKISSGIDAYEQLRIQAFAAGAQMDFGEPEATVEPLLKIVDSENPPLRIFFGTEGLNLVPREYEARLANWKVWETVSTAAHGKAQQHSIASL